MYWFLYPDTRTLRTETQSRKRACVCKITGVERDDFWHLVIKSCCNHSFGRSPPYFCCCLARAVNCCLHVREHQIAAAPATSLLYRMHVSQLFACSQLGWESTIFDSWDGSFGDLGHLKQVGEMNIVTFVMLYHEDMDELVTTVELSTI